MRRLIATSLVFTLLPGTALVSAADPDPAASGGFGPAGTFGVLREDPTVTLLLDGRVLVLGGGSPAAETWDPVTGRFDVAGVCPDHAGLRQRPFCRTDASCWSAGSVQAVSR